jgi:predicted GNAT family acetyltransferase
MADTPRVIDNAAAGQFEIHTGAGVAILTYVVRGDTVDLVHTRVPAQLEGQGYGAALATAALESARARGLKVIPTCPFVRTYMRRQN